MSQKITNNLKSNNQSMNQSMNQSVNDKSFKTNQKTSYLNQYTKIFSTSDDYKKLEYQLQLQLGVSKVEIDQIYYVAGSNKQFQNNFKNQNNNRKNFIIQSWAFVDDLGDNNKIEDVLKTGFKFENNQGLFFRTGRLTFPYEKELSNESKIYEILVSEIAPGKSQVHKIPYNEDQDLENYRNMQAKIKELSIKQPESDFQSHIIQYVKKKSNDEDKMNINDEDEDDDIKKEYYYDYILFKQEQVLPNYVIRVKLDKNSEKNTKSKCENCEIIDSEYYCHNCKAFLCENCNILEHSPINYNPKSGNMLKNKRLAEKHKVVAISEKQMIYTKCEDHPDNYCELYCTNQDCKKPICIKCQISPGSHSNIQKADHKLKSLEDVYYEAINESKELSPQLQQQYNKLTKNLTDIDNKISEIQKNSEDTIKKIYEMHVRALEQLNQETEKKLRFLLSEQLEISREIDQLDYTKSYLNYLKQMLNPVEFLQSWTRHQKLNEEIFQQQNSYSIDYQSIKADIIIQGKIDVVSKQNVNQNSQYQMSNQMDNLQLNNLVNMSKTFEAMNSQIKPKQQEYSNEKRQSYVKINVSNDYDNISQNKQQQINSQNMFLSAKQGISQFDNNNSQMSIIKKTTFADQPQSIIKK